MAQTIRYGLIGVGGVGKQHLQSLRALEEAGRICLVAVADPAVEKLSAQKEELEADGIRWHGDYSSLLAGEELDAITIAAPIPMHRQMVEAGIERGLHILLEKPPVPLVQQLEALMRMKGSKRVAVGFQLIASPEIQLLKKQITQGDLGKIQAIRFSACAPRLDSYYQRSNWAGRMTLNREPVFDGPATNALAHLIHNCMFLAGEGAQDFAMPLEVEGELYRVRPMESYDVSCMRGKFPSGISFTAFLSHASREAGPYRLEVRGDKGWVRLTNKTEWTGSSGTVSFEGAPSAFDLCYHDFIDFVEGKRASPATRLEDTLGYVAATNAALISSGGIHAVNGRFSSVYEKGDDRGYDLHDLLALTDRCYEENLLFSEAGAPWAKKPARISLDDFHFIDFENYC